MAKQLIANYTYNDAARTITLTDWTTVRLDRLMLIVNVTIGEIMYNFADSTVTATVATNVITLSSVPAAAADANKFIIVYDALTADTLYDKVAVKAADSDIVVLGAKTDAKSTATDTTSISAMQVLKQISYTLQQMNPPIITKIEPIEGTLTGASVATITIDTSAYTAVYEIEIINTSGSDYIRYTISPTNNSNPSDPSSTEGGLLTGAGVPSAITLPFNVIGNAIKVKLLSPSSIGYHVNIKGV
jgi:hypothetical protein